MASIRRKVTTERFIEDAIRIHGDKYDYTHVVCTTWKKKVKIICSIHGEFEQTPGGHIGLQKQGCPKCGIIQRALTTTCTTENFIERAKKVHGDTYEYTNTIYKNCDKKLIITCKVHGNFNITPTHFLRKIGCAKCGTERTTLAHRKSHDQFIRDAKEKHGDRYDYTQSIYINTLTPLIIICSKHGEFLQTPASHLYSNGCQACGIEMRTEFNRDSKEGFIKKAQDVHGLIYDYSKVNYNTQHHHVTIICMIHGEFQQSPGCHLSGCGCPCCGITKKINSLRHTLEEFREKAILIHGDKYDYNNNSTYVNTHTHTTITCKIHGNFQQTPHAHLYGQGCPNCISKTSKISTEWINMLKVSHPFIIQEYRIPTTLYVADAYDKETNTIYEFHGDYWHGNPSIYQPTVINERAKLSMGELYQQTITKRDKCIALGYRYIELWEKDWKKLKNMIKTLQRKIHHDNIKKTV